MSIVDGYLLNLVAGVAFVISFASRSSRFLSSGVTHLGASPYQKTADRREDYANGKEKRQNGLGSEDRSKGPEVSGDEVQRLPYDGRTYCHALRRCCLKAVSVDRKETRQRRNLEIQATEWRCQSCVLAGLLLFVFFCSSLLGSCASIESACWTCWVCDMAGELLGRQSCDCGWRKDARESCGERVVWKHLKGEV